MKSKFVFNNVLYPARARKILPYALAGAVICLVLKVSGLIDPEAQLPLAIFGGLCELIFVVCAAVNLIDIWKAFRLARKGGESIMDAWETALKEAIPPKAARLVLVEPRLYFYAVMSLTGGGKDEKKGYATSLNSFRLIFRVLLVLCIGEIAVVSMALPDRWMLWKVIHFAVGVYACLWIWTVYRTMGYCRHQVDSRGLKISMGIYADEDIGWDKIARIAPAIKSPPGIGARTVKEYPEILYLSGGDTCNILVEFTQPLSVQSTVNKIKGIKQVYLSLEKADDFLAEASRHRQAGPAGC